MDEREQAARAIAFFEQCDDAALLHQLTAEVAPRARKAIADFIARGGEDAIPAPAELRAARAAAPKDEAVRTLRAVRDFSLLTVLARAIGRRIEAIEIAASAEFPAGSRVQVPREPRYPRRGPTLAGEVELTGTSLTVRLDNGETWEGPPSLARLERPA